jgi:DNA-binding NarL/FixJ family response regulator
VGGQIQPAGRAAVAGRTIVIIDDGDREVAARVRDLLGREDFVHVVTHGPRIKPTMTASASLVLVVVGPVIDWAAIEAVAQGCDTVVLSRDGSRGNARRALGVGAVGYLALSLSDAALRAALFAVLAGETGYSRAILGEWLRGSRRHFRSNSAVLTSRQRQILQRIAHGDTDKEIAERLGIAVATAHKHVQNLLRRLGVPNRAAAVTHANEILVARDGLQEDSA